MRVILGLRLTQSVIKVLDMTIKNAKFFSDSTDELWWIRGKGRDFHPFIANRIGEIQMSSNPVQW